MKVHLYLLAFFFLGASLFAKEVTVNEEVVITSETLEYETEKLQATFLRNVKIIRSGTTMFADKVVCHFSKENELTTIVASGKVKILSGKQKVVAGRAVYRVASELIVLSKSPIIYNGDSVVKARKITLYQKEGKTVFEEPEGSYSESKGKILKKN